MTSKLQMMLTLLMLVGGCATIADETHEYGLGWRIGEVLKIGPGTANFPIAGVDCRNNLPPKDIAEQRFAYVQFVFDPIAGKFFYSGPRQRHAIVQIKDDPDVQEGDQVYVNIRDCGQPMDYRTPTSRKSSDTTN